uniref:Global regulator protein family n=1 Tax=Ascaris lumbricoides TaxID=6252 RepID=A0A0M3IJD9_ASCLU
MKEIDEVSVCSLRIAVDTHKSRLSRTSLIILLIR